MKPSDIILAKAAKRGEVTKDNVISAILDYLDERWEAEQPCKHTETEKFKSFHTGEEMTNCKKCRAVLSI